MVAASRPVPLAGTRLARWPTLIVTNLMQRHRDGGWSAGFSLSAGMTARTIVAATAGVISGRWFLPAGMLMPFATGSMMQPTPEHRV